MKRIALVSKKLLGRSESGQQIGSEKTGVEEKDLVEAPMRKPASNQLNEQADKSCGSK